MIGCKCSFCRNKAKLNYTIRNPLDYYYYYYHYYYHYHYHYYYYYYYKS